MSPPLSPHAPDSPAVPPVGLLDEQALDRLRALDPGGQAGLLARVIATYVSSLERLLEQLRSARAAVDVQGLRHVAHTLKSSSASVGALKLSALCADIERSIRDEPAVAIDTQLDELAREGERLLAALRH